MDQGVQHEMNFEITEMDNFFGGIRNVRIEESHIEFELVNNAEYPIFYYYDEINYETNVVWSRVGNQFPYFSVMNTSAAVLLPRSSVKLRADRPSIDYETISIYIENEKSSSSHLSIWPQSDYVDIDAQHVDTAGTR